MFVVTGATGHVGGVVARTLLGRNKNVRAIGRSKEKLKGLEEEGAEGFTADMTDEEGLYGAIRGAAGVFVMVPPNLATEDYRGYQDSVVAAVGGAVERAKISHVVTLSSIGADKESGTGPVVGLHRLEVRLSRIAGLNVVNLRAGFFMENLLMQVGIMRGMGKMAEALRGELWLPMIATRDIGEAAAELLLRLQFTGQQTRELLGPRDVTMREVAGIIGRAIGMPELTYGQVGPEEARWGMMQAGLKKGIIDLILEMAGALNSGHMRALEARSPRNTTRTTVEQFVEDTFVPAYQGQMTHA